MRFHLWVADSYILLSPHKIERERERERMRLGESLLAYVYTKSL